MTTSGWQHFEHQADIGLRAWGPDLGAALEQAGLALTAVITEPQRVVGREEVALSCAADDPEFLLVEWLDTLIYAMAIRRMLFAGFEVAISGAGGTYHLTATVLGEPVDRDRHQPAVEVKGATLTGLRAERGDGGWLLECVVDV
ncbi:archease [Thiohalorhabdus sp.]|uniref:archease n=1 Tax=Thiohalorhabdus sp. TaxID=3094134 RepID=UPI002FC300BE